MARALIRIKVGPLWYRVLTGMVGMKPAVNPPEESDNWGKQSSGWIYHFDLTPWWVHELPTGPAGAVWFRLFHLCRPQTISVHGWEYTEYCRCGAVRFGEVAFWSAGLAWKPSQGMPQVVELGGWRNRNSRYLGTAMHYEGHVRPVTEQKGV